MPQPQHQTATQPSTTPTSLSRADLIRALDQEVDRLLQARHLLAETLPAGAEISVPLRRQRPQLVSPLPPYPSVAMREIDLSAGSADLRTTAEKSVKPARRTRHITPAGRKKMQQAQARRWKKFHQAQKAAVKTLQKKSPVA